jgi:hypothetical protein
MLRRLYITVLGVLLTYVASAEVLVGATDTASYMSLLEGRRVALLVNHTAMYSAEEHVVDMLHREGVNIVGIFAPEHGFRGAVEAGYDVKDDVDAKTGISRANERIRASTEEAFRATVSGYSTVIRESAAVQLNNSSAKYALLPVWLLNTTCRGQKYTFAMNGQTGKLVGDLPQDQMALLKWFFGVFSIVTAVSFAIGWLIWGL